MTSPWRKTPPAAASTRKCCLAPPPDEVSCGAACKLRGGRGPPCLIRPRPCQAGAALLQTKLRRNVSIRYMRAEGSYCLEFGGISTLQRDIWCTHGRYHLLSDDTSAACRACNAPHDLLLLFFRRVS